MSVEPSIATEGTQMPPLRLDEDGIPILEDVVPDVEDPFPPAEPGPSAVDNSRAVLKAELLAALEPRLEALAHQAFTAAVKSVALEFKHAFEKELAAVLEDQLEQLVDEAVDKAGRDASAVEPKP